jgi:hypothetical protein
VGKKTSGDRKSSPLLSPLLISISTSVNIKEYQGKLRKYKSGDKKIKLII